MTPHTSIIDIVNNIEAKNPGISREIILDEIIRIVNSSNVQMDIVKNVNMPSELELRKQSRISESQSARGITHNQSRVGLALEILSLKEKYLERVPNKNLSFPLVEIFKEDGVTKIEPKFTKVLPMSQVWDTSTSVNNKNNYDTNVTNEKLRLNNEVNELLSNIEIRHAMGSPADIGIMRRTWEQISMFQDDAASLSKFKNLLEMDARLRKDTFTDTFINNIHNLPDVVKIEKGQNQIKKKGKKEQQKIELDEIEKLKKQISKLLGKVVLSEISYKSSILMRNFADGKISYEEYINTSMQFSSDVFQEWSRVISSLS